MIFNTFTGACLLLSRVKIHFHLLWLHFSHRQSHPVTRRPRSCAKLTHKKISNYKKTTFGVKIPRWKSKVAPFQWGMGAKYFREHFVKLGFLKDSRSNFFDPSSVNSIKDIRLQVYETVWGSTRYWGNKGTDSPVTRRTDRRRERLDLYDIARKNLVVH